MRKDPALRPRAANTLPPGLIIMPRARPFAWPTRAAAIPPAPTTPPTRAAPSMLATPQVMAARSVSFRSAAATHISMVMVLQRQGSYARALGLFETPAIEVKALGHEQGLLLTGPVRDYTMKKYTGHRRVPAILLQDLRRDMLALHAGAQAETGAAAALRARQSRGPGKAGEDHGRVGGCV